MNETVSTYTFNRRELVNICDSIETQKRTLARIAKNKPGIEGVAHQVIQELQQIIEKLGH